MVIETFAGNDMLPVYQRARERGRGLPDGLTYVNSWVEPSFRRCFQLMECNDLSLLQRWVLHWTGTGVSFDFFPVVSSAETVEAVTPYLRAHDT
ncbi:DUF3303 domain-containing protein [Rhizobacter sp. Root404]|uniref:DUF3303 domain-containing protein n=1 Tax=Rhizobacter sp. Root404 TaxID=1736528 RepID=UPI003526F869